MKQSLPISVVVPCFNRLEGLDDLLTSFREAQFSCELIVIDDGSNDDIGSVIKRFSDLDIQFYQNQINHGPAFSRNRGISLASHSLVAFTDDDCKVAQDWLIILYEAIKTASPKVVGVGGRILASHGDAYSRYFEYHKILDPILYKGQFFYLVTANSIFRKEKLLEVNGFDERLRNPGGEDPGLCFKLSQKGYRFGYAPEAIVFHRFRRGLWSFAKTFFRYGYGCAVQSKSHLHSIQTSQPLASFSGNEFLEDNE